MEVIRYLKCNIVSPLCAEHDAMSCANEMQSGHMFQPKMAVEIELITIHPLIIAKHLGAKNYKGMFS
jgi:hypothetical protein